MKGQTGRRGKSCKCLFSDESPPHPGRKKRRGRGRGRREKRKEKEEKGCRTEIKLELFC